MKIKVVQMGKFTELQEKRIKEAEEFLNSVITKPEFAEKVKLQVFSDGSNPLEVAKLFEIDREEHVNVAVWYVPWYKRYTSAIAFEAYNKVNLRSTYLERGDIKDLAATLLHEWTHTRGYSHDFWATKKRPTSVPYLLGSLVSG